MSLSVKILGFGSVIPKAVLESLRSHDITPLDLLHLTPTHHVHGLFLEDSGPDEDTSPLSLSHFVMIPR